MSKTRIHFVAPYLCNPVHRITVTLVGAGGNGSQMISVLARMDATLRKLGHKGLHVRLYDPDTVEEPNLGRQLFLESDLGVNKADALITRFNRGFGIDWQSIPRRIEKNDRLGNIVITCVDNIACRELVSLMLNEAGRRNNPHCPESCTYYWLDLGNGRSTGQAILGSTTIEQPKSRKFSPVDRLPSFCEEFDTPAIDEKDSGPSCSLAEALSKQDLFINSSLSQLAGSLLWKLFREPLLQYRGFYLNLDNFKTTPIPV